MGPFASVSPFTFLVGSFTCVGPLRFCVALLHLYRAFQYHMAPFHPRVASPSREVWGWCVLAVVAVVSIDQTRDIVFDWLLLSVLDKQQSVG